MGGHREQLTMEAQLALLGDSVEELESTVRRIDEALRGNGGPGIHTRIALQGERIKQLEGFAAEVKALKRWLMLGTFSVLGSLVWQATQIYLQTPTP